MPRELPEMPAQIAALPKDHRGYPIPWFVADEKDFRLIDERKRVLAVSHRICWVCGQPLGETIAFVGGVLSTSQRLYADPAMHPACAEFSMKVCPFMLFRANRRVTDMPDHRVIARGAVLDNPQVFGLLLTTGYVVVGDGHIKADQPARIIWYYGGRKATLREVRQAIREANAHPEIACRPHIRKLLRQLPVPAA